MARAAVGADLPLLDTRQINKPSPFGGAQKEWLEWKFKFTNYLFLVSDRYYDLLTAAEQSADPIADQADETRRRLQHVLYAVMASLLTGKCLKQLQVVPDQNGFEAWRLLVAEMEPRLIQHRLGMLNRLMSVDLSGTDDVFKERLSSWERDIAEYERLTTKHFDPELKMAVVLQRAPDGLRQHLQLSAHTFGNDWDRMRNVIEMYLQTRRVWQSGQGPAPMEVDYLGSRGAKGHASKGSTKGSQHQGQSKGSGDGKGSLPKGGKKGSGKGSTDMSQIECHHCGKKGHYARDCWSRASSWGSKPHQAGGKGRKGARSVETAGEMADEPEVSGIWEVMCLTDSHPSKDSPTMLLVDSGAFSHCCSPDFAPSSPVVPDPSLKAVFTASGAQLQPSGRKNVSFTLGNGLNVTISFIVLPVRRPILSVSALVEKGWGVCFSTSGGTLSKGDFEIPLQTRGAMYFLSARTLDVSTPTSKVTRISKQLLAPVGGESDLEEPPKPRGVLDVIRRARDASSASGSGLAQAPEVGEPAALPDGPEEVEEAVVPRLAHHPKEPSEAERKRHMLTHLPFREWCPECLAAKGKSSPHFQEG